MAIQSIKDADWIRQSFILPRGAITNLGAKRVVNSDASLKFTDTTLGGAFAINPLPQFNEFTDIPVENRWGSGTALGRYYSEAYDDNQRYIHMRFGVAEFNSLTSFFGNFYSYEASVLAREGRASTSLFYTLGKAAGFLVALPLQPFIMAGAVIRWALKVPSTKYYYLKPAMALYWQAVTTIANAIMVNMGFIPPVHTGGAADIEDPNNKVTANDLKKWSAAFPDLFSADGGIDVFAIATRSQRLADRNRRRIMEILEEATSTEQLQKKVEAYASEKLDAGKTPRLTDYLERYLATTAGQKQAESEKTAETPSTDKTKGTPVRGWWEGFADFGMAELHDGSEWITWRVSGSSSVSESFSNSIGTPEIADTINGMSSSGRQADFSWANGLDITGGAIEAVANKFKDVVGGVADQLHISGLSVLKGRAFADIPKMWESSEFQFPRIDYKMELRSWSGDDMSRIMSLIIPVAMALPMVMPISTGGHSFTSPLLVELYDKGRCQTRLGIVESLTIERGVGNLGWTVDGQPLGIDISFSVSDLSSIMHMPITAGFTLNDPVSQIFPEDSMFNDYLAVLGSLGLHEQIYFSQRLQVSLTKYITNFRSWKSPAHWANISRGTLPGRVLSAFSNNMAGR